MTETHSSEKPDRPRRLYRSESNRVLGGVAAGIAAYFGVDPNVVRFLFIILTLMRGSGILIYLILWLLLPKETGDIAVTEDTIRHNANEIKDRAEDLVQNVKRSQKSPSSQWWFGAFLIVLGVLFLLNNFGMLWWFSMEKMWPLILIMLGVVVLFRND